MIVSRIELENFRNIERASLSFSNTFNLFTGKNSQGKTNMLEAIHLFSLGRSFRTRRQDELIMFDREYFFLSLGGESDTGVKFNLDMGREKGGRFKVSVNGKKLSSISEIIGVIPTVIFTAEDIYLTSGPPAARRTFLDYTNAQISPLFLEELKDYRRIIKHRNALLRRVGEGEIDAEELGAWDEILSEKGAAVVEGRMAIAGEVERRAGELLAEILAGDEPIRLDYRRSFGSEGSNNRESLLEALRESRWNELRRGYTLAGPHYDDVGIYIGDIDIRKYGSQGRRRLVAIVLKLAQAATIMEMRDERPVVLLDDIFSELDDEITSRLGGLLSDRYQSFITSPGRGGIPREAEGASVFHVEMGRISGAECESDTPEV